jgi:hypothetical protein
MQNRVQDLMRGVGQCVARCSVGWKSTCYHIPGRTCVKDFPWDRRTQVRGRLTPAERGRRMPGLRPFAPADGGPQDKTRATEAHWPRESMLSAVEALRAPTEHNAADAVLSADAVPRRAGSVGDAG